LAGKLLRCQAERDGNALRLEQLVQGDPLGSYDEGVQQMGIVQQHLQRIADLEAEVKRLKKVFALTFCQYLQTLSYGALVSVGILPKQSLKLGAKGVEMGRGGGEGFVLIISIW